ncbi:MAG TPA: peptide-methionine (S)-S-oxide reductase MsrA [Prolixibacteraceae bacterium]|nr:peptide-methionine (S)-S-oxide reductase MsrA [Prolixibacteraceae bacterium]
MNNKIEPNNETAVFGGGCFWCTEAVFSNLKGVNNVVPGYSGGTLENPTYNDVCTGETGHAEVIKIEFDPKEISFEQLLEVFFQTHDPTTLNRQGADVGTQYRSVIFYTNIEQKQLAEKYIEKLDDKKLHERKIVTEISELSEFYSAENYHIDYYSRNSNQPYCRFVIDPKIEKLNKHFKHLIAE